MDGGSVSVASLLGNAVVDHVQLQKMLISSYVFGNEEQSEVKICSWIPFFRTQQNLHLLREARSWIEVSSHPHSVELNPKLNVNVVLASGAPPPSVQQCWAISEVHPGSTVRFLDHCVTIQPKYPLWVLLSCSGLFHVYSMSHMITWLQPATKEASGQSS